LVANLESRTESAPRLSRTERIHSSPEVFARYVEEAGRNNPSFRKAIRGLSREEQLEIGKKLADYSNNIIEDSPQTSRMASLGEMYDQIPDDEQIPEGKSAREVIMGRVYGMPGRQYPSINAIAGNKTSAVDIRREIGKTLGHTVRSGWPGLLAGAGWFATDKWYKGKATKGILKRVAEGFSSSPFDYIPVFGKKGVTGLIGDTAKTTAAEGAYQTWGAVSTPIVYLIGAYVAYKALKSVLKRRKERKIEDMERLEQMSRGVSLQNKLLSDRVAFAG